jgi:hypothetical protein
MNIMPKNLTKFNISWLCRIDANNDPVNIWLKKGSTVLRVRASMINYIKEFNYKQLCHMPTEIHMNLNSYILRVRVMLITHFSAFLFAFWLLGVLTKSCRKENATGANVVRATIREATIARATTWAATFMDSILMK